MTKQEIHTGLYSYPKSGNTWLRAIITAGYKMPGGQDVISTYVPDTANQDVGTTPFEKDGINWYFYKSHAKELLTEHRGKSLHTDKIIYIYRHPLDVFMSFLNFQSNNVTGNGGKQLGLEFDSVDALTPAQFEMLYSRFVGFGTLIPQNKKFGSLFESYHLFKKRQAEKGDVHIIRYEDLKQDFASHVTQMFEFLGIDAGNMEAVNRRTEALTKTDGKFFWKRKSNNYRDYLTDEQINRFNMVYAKELNEMGYSAG